MTLRAIEIVESCLNFFANAMKTIRRSRTFASQAPQTRFAKMQTLGIPPHSHFRSTLATANF